VVTTESATGLAVRFISIAASTLSAGSRHLRRDYHDIAPRQESGPTNLPRWSVGASRIATPCVTRRFFTQR